LQIAFREFRRKRIANVYKGGINGAERWMFGSHDSSAIQKSSVTQTKIAISDP
jgi:hypothetical protein